MMQLNKQLLSTLESHVPQDMLQKFIQKYKHEQQNQLKKINTPATNCTNTSWRKQGGNAIDKIKKRRKNMLEKEQKEKVQNPINIDENVKQQSIQQLENNSNIQQSKMIIKNRAVFFGEECQLPYLHSSDAITHLYSKKLKEHQKQEILFNPTSNIDRSYMTSLRSLHIYHTNIQSLRQLGTGWCQLKQLSIIYGKLSDLSGLSSFSSLEYLYLSFNKISSLSELMFHPSIKYVDLQRNKIENIQQIQYLSTMAKIESINLNLNPIMKIKQQKRIIQQKLSQLLQPQDYTRDIEYQLQDLTKHHEILGYQNIQMSNYLIRNCNQLMNQDQISFQNVYDSYQLNENYEKKEEKLDFLRYQLKVQEEIIAQTQEIIEIQQQEVIFTPLIHFLTGKKHYTTILKKYLENKIYLNMKKKDNMDKSPGMKDLQHNPSLRLNKFAFSSKLPKDQDVHSLEKGQNFSKEANSLGKTKLNRLSLGKTRRLLQKVDKSPNAVTLTSKFNSNLLSKTSSGLKSFPLKRSSMLTKKSNDNNDLQLQMHKKFSQTATLNHEE